MIRMYRVCGDSISCRFDPSGNGSLSTALLVSRGSQRNVAPHLPGITEENAVKYLQEAGWSDKYDPVSLEIGRVLNERLEDKNLLVELVKKVDDGWVISVIYLPHRYYAVPVRSFIGLYQKEADEFVPYQVNNEEHYADFLDVILLKN